MSRRSRRVVVVLALLAAGWLASGVLASYVLTARTRPPFDEPAPVGHEAIRLHTHDGLSLGAWWDERPRDRAAVVLLHGNGGSRSDLAAHAETFRSLGCSTLAVSLRAHGDSEGDHNDLGHSARWDVIAAVEWLRARDASRPVVVAGFSLGAAAALYASPDLDADGYVLAAPYADLRLATRRRTRRYLPPGLEALAYSALTVGARFWLPDLDELRPAERARVPPNVPTLIFVGEADDRAPPSDAEAIASRLTRVTVERVPGADHETTIDHPTTSAGRRSVARLLHEVAPRAHDVGAP
ncbi:MAG: alpha/beta hydrolase [Sandaracinus sp.]|nr:alpha/beta hydrolase [Sandaracinus sp.]